MKSLSSYITEAMESRSVGRNNMKDLTFICTAIILGTDDLNDFDDEIVDEIQDSVKQWIDTNNVTNVNVYIDKEMAEDCFGIDYLNEKFKKLLPVKQIKYVNMFNEVRKIKWNKSERDYFRRSEVKMSPTHYFNGSGATYYVMFEKII